jgi:hypothetical protein
MMPLSSFENFNHQNTDQIIAITNTQTHSRSQKYKYNQPQIHANTRCHEKRIKSFTLWIDCFLSAYNYQMKMWSDVLSGNNENVFDWFISLIPLVSHFGISDRCFIVRQTIRRHAQHSVKRVTQYTWATEKESMAWWHNIGWIMILFLYRLWVDLNRAWRNDPRERADSIFLRLSQMASNSPHATIQLRSWRPSWNGGRLSGLEPSQIWWFMQKMRDTPYDWHQNHHLSHQMHHVHEMSCCHELFGGALIQKIIRVGTSKTLRFRSESKYHAFGDA